MSPQAAPDESTFVDVEFVKGVPVKMTNKKDGTVKVSFIQQLKKFHFISAYGISHSYTLSPIHRRPILSNYSCTPTN